MLSKRRVVCLLDRTYLPQPHLPPEINSQLLSLVDGHIDSAVRSFFPYLPCIFDFVAQHSHRPSISTPPLRRFFTRKPINKKSLLDPTYFSKLQLGLV